MQTAVIPVKYKKDLETEMKSVLIQERLFHNPPDRKVRNFEKATLDVSAERILFYLWVRK